MIMNGIYMIGWFILAPSHHIEKARAEVPLADISGWGYTYVDHGPVIYLL